MLLSALDFNRYSPRTYITSEGDILSARKAVALELSKTAGSAAHIVRVSPSVLEFDDLLRQRGVVSFP